MTITPVHRNTTLHDPDTDAHDRAVRKAVTRLITDPDIDPAATPLEAVAAAAPDADAVTTVATFRDTDTGEWEIDEIIHITPDNHGVVHIEAVVDTQFSGWHTLIMAVRIEDYLHAVHTTRSTDTAQ